MEEENISKKITENLGNRIKTSSTIWVVIVALLIFVNFQVQNWLLKDGVSDTIILQSLTFLTTVFGLYLGKEGLRLGFGNRK